MRRPITLAIVGAAVVFTLAGGAAVAGAVTGSDEESITGPAADQAAAAALTQVDGRVLGVEKADDDGAAYEVEIQTPGGSEVEVLVDSSFTVISSQNDDADADDNQDFDGDGEDPVGEDQGNGDAETTGDAGD